jgi:hypothetical protein
MLKLFLRWQSLDQGLSRGGVVLSDFAEVWMVDVKTVRRDLKAFKQLGHPAVCRPRKARYPGVKALVHVWRYAPGVRALFTCNLDDRPKH